MAPEVDVPGVGNVDQKYVWAGGALVAGIVGYAWWKRSTSSAPVVPGVDTFPDAGTGGASGYQNPDPNNPPSIHPGGIGSAPTTDVEWTARVTETLGNMGYDVLALSKVLAKYLARQPLSPEETSWIQTAWAYVGKPPGGSYPITPTPIPTTPPPPPPVAWKGPLVRKAAGGPVRSINTARGSGSGRWTWPQVVGQMYANVPTDPRKLAAAGSQLYRANAWRRGVTGSTVPVNSTVSVPAAIYV